MRTTSVCTGALLLADDLARLGANPVQARVVRRGKVITGAGVGAGIDMALTLVGEIAGADYARTVQLMFEYDPQPPYDAGSPKKAGPRLVGSAMAAMMQAMARITARARGVAPA